MLDRKEGYSQWFGGLLRPLFLFLERRCNKSRLILSFLIPAHSLLHLEVRDMADWTIGGEVFDT
jgi:hypothetical protein